MSMAFRRGASGSSLAMRYLGSGHRFEVYDEDGSLTLINTTSGYMRGFERRQARRPAMALALIDVDDSVDRAFVTDGRIAPVSPSRGRFPRCHLAPQVGLAGFCRRLSHSDFARHRPPLFVRH